jgi:hypothetical protein
MRILKRIRNERGATLALVAVATSGLLAMMSLAVDLGMLFKTRREAQRAADASALAGASAFLQNSGVAAVPDANARAYEYATKNHMTGGYVDASEVTVQVIPDSSKVRVWVRRAAVPTWFSRIFGISQVPVGAKAAARATPAGTAQCVVPWAMPDLWAETTEDTNPNNRMWDPDEGWEYDPLTGDRYEQWDGTSPSLGTNTGFGSNYRDGNGSGAVGDYGLPVTLKSQRPGDAITSGFFYPWRMPMSDGSTASGANDYSDLVEDEDCDLSDPVELGTTYDIETGNMVGQTKSSAEYLMGLDPGASWDPSTKQVVGSKFDNWVDSPRVVQLAIFDPKYITDIQGAGTLTIQFNNFSLFFLEEFDKSYKPASQAPVRGRFLFFGKGYSGGPTVGPLVRLVQLVE